MHLKNRLRALLGPDSSWKLKSNASISRLREPRTSHKSGGFVSGQRGEAEATACYLRMHLRQTLCGRRGNRELQEG